MFPQRTVYRLATTPHDYARCHALLRAQGLRRVTLSFPTVVAERERDLIGFLATHSRSDAVVAGPMVLGLPRAGVLAMRLGEAYEILMRRAGVRVYLFHVESRHGAWRAILERLGFTPYAEDPLGGAFFRRELIPGVPAHAPAPVTA